MFNNSESRFCRASARQVLIRIFFVFLVLAFFFQLAPADFPLFFGRAEEEEEEIFIVGKGMTDEDIIQELHQRGLIRNSAAFRLILKIQKWENQIEPGGYLLSKNMPALEIAETLVIPPSQNWVRIPEGLRKEEVASILQLGLNWLRPQREDFLQWTKEGYLSPDTYLLPLNWSGNKVAEMLENQFIEKFKEIFGEDPEFDVITLASMIQREAANKDEMPLIAGIILNRYQNNHLLQIDATLQYALGTPSKWWPVVWPEDRSTQSLYNTYLYRGYPPTPICSPGAAALEAAINPQPTDYLYYLHDWNRQIHCAETYRQHLINIQKYLW